jgi:hypothetical protein
VQIEKEAPGMTVKTFSLILSVCVLLSIMELARREKISFKYAMPWFILSLTAIFFAVFDKWLLRLAFALGFELASNFIFFTCLCGFVFLSLFLTIFVCQLNERNEKMAQLIGLLEYEIRKLKAGADEKQESEKD